MGVFRFFLKNGGQGRAVTKAWAARRHKESTVCKAGLQGVKRSRLSETLGLTPEEVETLCAGLDKMPGRSYEDEIFKKPEHKWLGRGGGASGMGRSSAQASGQRLALAGCLLPARALSHLSCRRHAAKASPASTPATGVIGAGLGAGGAWCSSRR